MDGLSPKEYKILYKIPTNTTINNKYRIIDALNGFTLSLARELAPKGIRVNAVAPGITETDMMTAVPKEVIEPMIAQIPLRRLGQPEDIANAFVFLASEEASYITGVVLSVDGMART